MHQDYRVNPQSRALPRPLRGAGFVEGRTAAGSTRAGNGCHMQGAEQAGGVPRSLCTPLSCLALFVVGCGDSCPLNTHRSVIPMPFPQGGTEHCRDYRVPTLCLLPQPLQVLLSHLAPPSSFPGHPSPSKAPAFLSQPHSHHHSSYTHRGSHLQLPALPSASRMHMAGTQGHLRSPLPLSCSRVPGESPHCSSQQTGWYFREERGL